MTKPSKAKCRFCDAGPMSFGALRRHVFVEHADQAFRIRDSLPAIPQTNRFDYGAGKAGVGHEFRKRMGYSSRDGSAPDAKDPEER